MDNKQIHEIETEQKVSKSQSPLKTVLLAVLAVAVFVGIYFLYNSLSQGNLDKVQSGQTLQSQAPSDQAETATTSAAVDMDASSAAESADSSSAPDYSAPEINIVDLDGKAISLADFKGKTVILNFWASWCPPCKAEFPDFQKFYETTKDAEDVAMVLVNLLGSNGETAEKANAFITENNYTVPYYFDVNGESATTYQIKYIPTTYIITPGGELYYRNEGIMSFDKLVEMSAKAAE